MALEQRYKSDDINRAFWLSDAMIKLYPAAWRTIDEVAKDCSNAEIEAFCKIVAKLNENKPL